MDLARTPVETLPRDELLVRFVEELGALRAGEDAAAAPLIACAERLCDELGRCDPVDIAAYYASLDAADRRAGLALEGRYAELFLRVHAAGELSAAEWELERPALRADLDALLDDARAAADGVPAGRALSLSAILLESRLGGDALDPGERQRLARRAEAEAREAIDLLDRAGMVKVALEPRETLASLLRDRGQLRQSRALYGRVLEDAGRVAHDDFREKALVGLIGLSRQTGDLREEERHIRTLATFRDPADSWLLAHEHGWHLLLTDNAREAMAFLERNRPRGDADRDAVEWNFLMSMAATWAGEPDLAQSYLDDAPFDVPDHEPYVLAQARIHLARGDHHAVLTLLSDAYLLDELRPREQVVAQTMLGEALLRTGMVEAAVEELEVALELCEEWTGQVEEEHALTTGPLGVIGEWMGLHTIALLAEAYAALDRDLDAARVIEDCQSRSLRTDADLAELRRHVGQPAGGPRLTHADLLAWAAEAELGLVTWVVGAEHTVVVHVAPSGEARARVTRLGRSEIQEGVRKLRDRARSAAREADVARLAGTGSELARHLLPDTLLRALAAGGPERGLLALVHGPVESLPFSLLTVDGLPLDELCTLRVLPGVPASRPGAAAPLDLTAWSLLGAPDVQDGELDLPAARRELETLVRRYGAEHAAVGADFVAAEVERLLPAGRPAHLSTHLLPTDECSSGRFADVGLLLAGGEVLCLERLRDMAPALPLAVLSACGTGLGEAYDAEGQQSVARVLLESGTRNVLVTLWPVEDEAARRFSERFHDALAGGATPAEAARDARSSLRRAGAPADAWAVFRLVGRD